MSFNELLQSYMESLNCSAKKLADTSGLSASVISRYRSGERMPAPGSEQLSKLVQGLYDIAAADNVTDITNRNLQEEFVKALSQGDSFTEGLSGKINAIMDTLGLSQATLAKGISYEPSRLSRIRSGERKPKDPEEFIQKVSDYISKTYNDSESLQKLADMLQTKAESLPDAKAIYTLTYDWLKGTTKKTEQKLSDSAKKTEKKITDSAKKAEKKVKKAAKTAAEKAGVKPAQKSGKKIPGKSNAEKTSRKSSGKSKDTDVFSPELNEVISTMANTRLNPVVDIPETISLLRASLLPVSRDYDGRHLMTAHLDFTARLLAMHSDGPLLIFDSMLPELSKADDSFMNSMVSRLLLGVSQGLEIRLMIPTATSKEDRGFLLRELMPLLLTGHFSIYTTTPEDGLEDVYRPLAGIHGFAYATDDLICYGDSSAEDPSRGMAVLTRKKEDIAYFGGMLNRLYDHSTLLAQGFRLDRRKDFKAFLESFSKEKGSRSIYAGSLPIETMPEDLLSEILERNHIPERRQHIIRSYQSRAKKRLEDTMAVTSLHVKLPSTGSVMLLDELFYPAPILYTPKEYEDHLNATLAFAKDHKKYKVETVESHPFGRVSVTVQKKGKIVLTRGGRTPVQLVLYPQLLGE